MRTLILLLVLPFVVNSIEFPFESTEPNCKMGEMACPVTACLPNLPQDCRETVICIPYEQELENVQGPCQIFCPGNCAPGMQQIIVNDPNEFNCPVPHCVGKK